MRSRSGRFTDLVDRQLDLFEQDEAELIRHTEAALASYNRAPRDEAEERYGDYVDRVDLAAEALAELRNTYARTLEEDEAEEYEAVFEKAAAKRFPRLGSALGEI